MSESAESAMDAVAVFDELVAARPAARADVLFDTACVLGGSVAGLLAARVLSDYARRVVIVERDAVSTDGRPRAGTPHDQQVHALLPVGVHWLDRWFPGFGAQASDSGAVLSGPERTFTAFDGIRQANSGVASHVLLHASRPFLEARIRERVLALPNVSVLQARATGLEYREGAVSAVRFTGGETEGILEADFFVDAMGRSSRLSEWVAERGYERPTVGRDQRCGRSGGGPPAALGDAAGDGSQPRQRVGGGRAQRRLVHAAASGHPGRNQDQLARRNHGQRSNHRRHLGHRA